LTHQIRLRGRIRGRTFIQASLVSGITVLGLALSPLAANASATLSGSGQAWGATYGSAESNAEAQAYGNLMALASSKGYSTCVNVTYSDSLVYVVPGGGGDVFNSTATGLCGTLVFRAGATLSGSGQAWGATYGSAESNAEAQAYGNLMALASSKGYSTCVNVTYSDSLVYVVPGGGGDVFNSTATGLCGNQVLQ
jgi:hypothetical protein